MQGAHLVVQIQGLLRPGPVAHAPHPLQVAGVKQVLELVGLVDGQVIDP